VITETRAATPGIISGRHDALSWNSVSYALRHMRHSACLQSAATDGPTYLDCYIGSAHGGSKRAHTCCQLKPKSGASWGSRMTCRSLSDNTGSPGISALACTCNGPGTRPDTYWLSKLAGQPAQPKPADDPPAAPRRSARVTAWAEWRGSKTKQQNHPNCQAWARQAATHAACKSWIQPRAATADRACPGAPIAQQQCATHTKSGH